MSAPAASPRGLEEAGVEPELHDMIIGVAVRCAATAPASRAARSGSSLTCRDRGEAGEGVLGDGQDDESWLSVSVRGTPRRRLRCRRARARPARRCCARASTGRAVRAGGHGDGAIEIHRAASASQPLRSGRAGRDAVQRAQWWRCPRLRAAALPRRRGRETHRRCPPRALAPRRPSRSSTVAGASARSPSASSAAQQRLVGSADVAHAARRSYRERRRGWRVRDASARSPRPPIAAPAARPCARQPRAARAPCTARGRAPPDQRRCPSCCSAGSTQCRASSKRSRRCQ